MPSDDDTLSSLAESWRGRVGLPRRRALFGVVALVFLGSLLLARQGTSRARLLAAACIVLPLVVLFVARRLEARLWGDPARVIRRVASPVDPERAARALRALRLVPAGASEASEETEEGPLRDGTSLELARLHLVRTLAALPRDRIEDAAGTLGARFGFAALLLGAVVLVVTATHAWGVVEGADVLAASHGEAPMKMIWFDGVEVEARPPDYLHEEARELRPYLPMSLPRGTLLTVRGAPAHPGRRIALTDGTSEVPFVDDGTGHVVARWPLAESVDLRVVARFGDVVIGEPETTEVISIPDEAPVVTLEDAPRTITLATATEGDIPIRYEATDDHGLREVHLVLRSGAREERRVLARLDGETRFDRGGHVLRASDPFLKKSHAPVEVRVEAKDNDPITGPKWGASSPITVVPPDVGEPEAQRLSGLRKLRDALVDSLAWRIGHDVPKDPKERRLMIDAELRGADEDTELLDATLASSYAGLRIVARLQAMLRGQMRKVREAMNKEARAPTAQTHAALVKATERLVLVVDAMIRGLGQRDTRDAAKLLAEVADDLALGASQIQRPADRERGTMRADASVTVLVGGARSLVKLGSLGRDLGEIVTADLSRVRRARTDEDLVHAEIAAHDLAARLREPDPSFGAQGRSRAGGESGGARGTPGEDEESGDDAEQAFNMAAQELERIAQDHAEEVGKVEQALNGAMSSDELRQLEDEAKKHAQAVRDATKALPSVGAGSDSWTNKGAAAKEHAEAMARALEQGNPADAVSAGQSALEAIDEARHVAQRERWMGPFSPSDTDLDRRGADKRLADARQRLEPEVKWAEEQLASLRKKAAERKAGELSDHGDEENKLADRVKGLSEKGRDQQALPEPALDALDGAEKSAREAASALKRGEADRALEQQREAQRQLEMAREALGNEGNEEHGDDGNLDRPNGDVDIPKAEAHKGPEEFRRRVIKGLGQAASGRQKDAVRRYADGLLR